VPVPVTTAAPVTTVPAQPAVTSTVVTSTVVQPSTVRPANSPRPAATGLINTWLNKPTPPAVITPAPVITPVPVTTPAPVTTTTPAAPTTTPSGAPVYVPLPPPGSAQPTTTSVPASNTRSALTPSTAPVVGTTYSGTRGGDVRPAVATQPTDAAPSVVPLGSAATTATPSPYTQTAPAKSSSVPTAAAKSNYVQTAPAKPSYVPTAAAQPTHTVTVTVHPKDRLLVFFHRSTDFQHREWAAGQMALLSDGGKDEQVVAALLKGAETDTAPTVKIACLTSIRTLGIRHPRVATILKRLQGDTDLRVRATAAEVQRWLDGGVQQVSHTTARR